MKKYQKLFIILGAVVAVTVCVILLIPCEHVYHGEITLAATCTAEGIETFTCEKCAHSYTQPVAIIEHSYDAVGQILTAPTCIAAGVCEKKCTACDAKITEEVAPIPHTYGEAYVSKEPNCTEQGEKSAVCTACQGTFVVEQLPTNDAHDMKMETITASTCTVAGQGKNICSRCGHTETVALEILAHNFKLTYESEGYCHFPSVRYLSCEGCGATTTQEGERDPNNHGPGVMNTHSGWYCPICRTGY